MVEVEDEDYNMSIQYPKYSKVAYKTGQDFNRSYTQERFSRLESPFGDRVNITSLDKNSSCEM